MSTFQSRYTADQMPEQAETSPAAVARFVERFALVFSEAGVPRMPARIFVGLLVSPQGQLTAAQLGEQLKVSPAAISGAVRYLTQVGLVVREREPGQRRDHYRVQNDLWYEPMTNREEQLNRWIDALGEGIAALERLGGGSAPGGNPAVLRVYAGRIASAVDQVAGLPAADSPGFVSAGFTGPVPSL